MQKLCTAAEVRYLGERVGFPGNSRLRDQVGEGQGLCLKSWMRKIKSLPLSSLCLSSGNIVFLLD